CRLSADRLETRSGRDPCRPRQSDPRGRRKLETGRPPALERQDAHRPRRRAQAHRRHARQGRAAPRRVQGPRHLLCRPGRSGRRGNRRPRRSDHRDAHGQVHGHDAGSRPARLRRQGRTRPRRDTIDRQAQERLSDGRWRCGLPRRACDQGQQG
ncbi:hypothetical protein GMDG_09071, partial [Pseudogymnoascus destructans 20631-21]